MDDHPLAGSPERPGVNGGLRGASDAPEVLRTGLRVAAVALAIDGRLCGQQSSRVPWIAAAGGSTRGGGREQEGKGNAGSQKPTGREAQGVLLCPPPPWRTGASRPTRSAIRQALCHRPDGRSTRRLPPRGDSGGTIGFSAPLPASHVTSVVRVSSENARNTADRACLTCSGDDQEALRPFRGPAEPSPQAFGRLHQGFPPLRKPPAQPRQ